MPIINPAVDGLSDAPPDYNQKTHAFDFFNMHPIPTEVKVRNGLYLWGRVPEYTGKATIHSFKGKFPNNPFNDQIVVCTSNSYYQVNFRETALPNGGRISTGAKTDSEADRLTIHRAPSIGNILRDNLDFSDAVSALYTTPTESNLIICNPNESFVPIVLRDVGGDTFIQSVQREVAGEITLDRSAANLVYPFEFQERLCFIEKDSFKIWYDRDGQVTPTELILNDYQIAANLELGGTLLFAFPLGSDTGSGWSNFLVCVTTEGEAILIEVPDTGFEDASVRDVYFIGKPLGRSAHFKLNDDTYIATVKGLTKFKAVTQQDIETGQVYISNSIFQRWKDIAIQAEKDWTVTQYSASNDDIILVCPPKSDNYPDTTFIYSTQNKAWGKWDIAIEDATVSNDELFILSGTNVYKYRGHQDQEASEDNTSIINNDVKWSYRPRFISMSGQYISELKRVRVEYFSKARLNIQVSAIDMEDIPDYSRLDNISALPSLNLQERKLWSKNRLSINKRGKRLSIFVEGAINSPEDVEIGMQSIEYEFVKGVQSI